MATATGEGIASVIISLIGYRGTGKTTIGSLLAERLGWTCLDTDLQVEDFANKSIQQIFAEDGEATFRDYETRVILELVRRHKLVLALGGGAILREENRRALSVAGPVFWLKATPATIRARLGQDPRTTTQRPSLTGGSALDEIEQVLSQREPLYASCADRQIDTDGKIPREIVDDIVAELDLPPA